MTTPRSESEVPALDMLDALYHHQLRSAVAEVAAAIAHAAGTPLNVISGRAELIRQDPSNAIAQVARIEEQVNKLATGLRQLVDYLANADLARQDVPATELVEEIRSLMAPLFRAHGLELQINARGLDSCTLDRSRVIDILSTLVSWAARERAQSKGAKVQLSVTAAEGAMTFELLVPELPFAEGWRLEQFTSRPPATASAQSYRTLAICAAMARGRGDRLSVEAGPNGKGISVRLTSEVASRNG